MRFFGALLLLLLDGSEHSYPGFRLHQLTGKSGGTGILPCDDRSFGPVHCNDVAGERPFGCLIRHDFVDDRIQRGGEEPLEPVRTQVCQSECASCSAQAVATAEFGASVPGIVAQPPFSMMDRRSHVDTLLNSASFADASAWC